MYVLLIFSVDNNPASDEPDFKIHPFNINQQSVSNDSSSQSDIGDSTIFSGILY